MKRCPTCNQQFTDEWLTFCTQDGSSLVEVTGSSNEPPPTVAYSAPMPPSVSPLEQPTMDYPGGYKPPPIQMSTPQSMQPGWSPPPPPAYAAQPQKTMALFSMILGIVSITIGWCCWFGVLTSPVAIGLGIFALFQIKQDPSKYGGKGMAIAGIVTGSLYFVFAALIAIIWGLGVLMSAPS
jgi:hypothetical protein